MRSFGCALFILRGGNVGFRFRKSINLGGGFRVNLSKSGIGYSWGTKGARFTKTASGKSRTTLNIPGTGLSYSTESSQTKAQNKPSTTNSVPTSVHTTSSNRERSNSMKWVDFLLCFFLGILGIHKFREGKVGLGLLYLFTGGLCGIGWIVDCIKYFVAAVSTQQSYDIPPINSTDTTIPTVATNGHEIDAPTQTVGSFLKQYWRWIVIAILCILVLGTIPSFFGFLALLVIALILPVAKWQAFLNKYVKSKTRNILAGVLAALSLFILPGNTDEPLPEASEPTNPVVIESDATVHIHDFVDASCLSAKTCKTCGETEGDALDHIWIDATCLRPKHCSVCNAATGNLGSHAWENATCLAPQTCSVCQKTAGELADHQWQDATCTAPKSCPVCGVTDGDVIEHTWEKATCQKPKTCSACGTTTGDLSDHDWTKATCQTRKTCNVCGEEEGGYADCKYKNGKCVNCGDSEPTVWIPKSGSKYHSNSTCSKMKNPKKVTLSTAKKKGYTACNRCH